LDEPNLSAGFRIGAALVGFLGFLASILLLFMSPVGALVLMLIAFLFLYIGISGNQRSWAARVLLFIGGGISLR
jgi:hypothetical protein